MFETCIWLKLQQIECSFTNSNVVLALLELGDPLLIFFFDISRCFQTTLKRQYLLFVQTFLTHQSYNSNFHDLQHVEVLSITITLIYSQSRRNS